jgi:hypothetical protein
MQNQCRSIEGVEVNTPIRNDTREKLIHVHSMLRELRTIVEAERCDMLAHLIEMAYLESGDILRGSRPLRSGRASGIRIASDRGK